MNMSKIKLYNLICGFILGVLATSLLVVTTSVHESNTANINNHHCALLRPQSKLLRAKEVYKTYYLHTGIITNDFKAVCDYLDKHNLDKVDTCHRLSDVFNSIVNCEINGTKVKLSESVDEIRFHPEIIISCQLEFNLKEEFVGNGHLNGGERK